MFALPWDMHEVIIDEEEEKKNRYYQEYILNLINKKSDE